MVFEEAFQSLWKYSKCLNKTDNHPLWTFLLTVFLPHSTSKLVGHKTHSVMLTHKNISVVLGLCFCEFCLLFSISHFSRGKIQLHKIHSGNNPLGCYRKNGFRVFLTPAAVKNIKPCYSVFCLFSHLGLLSVSRWMKWIRTGKIYFIMRMRTFA